MKFIKRAIITFAVIIILLVLVLGINILQNGFGGWDGRTMDEILQVLAENATAEDIAKLSKSEIMQLFYAADAPVFTKIKGEYKAKLVPVGILSSSTEFYAHNFMGPGHWEAKSFFPFEEKKGSGYNLFTVDQEGTSKLVRTLEMDTFIGKSKFDDKESFHLVYENYNDDWNHSMYDEIRKINDKLYLGYGYSTWNLGTLNPFPFVLYGAPSKWVGPDATVN